MSSWCHFSPGLPRAARREEGGAAGGGVRLNTSHPTVAHSTAGMNMPS